MGRRSQQQTTKNGSPPKGKNTREKVTEKETKKDPLQPSIKKDTNPSKMAGVHDLNLFTHLLQQSDAKQEARRKAEREADKADREADNAEREADKAEREADKADRLQLEVKLLSQQATSMSSFAPLGLLALIDI